jgi:hypothetical protein
MSKIKSKGHGVIETQAVETTVSGRLGEWIELAMVVQDMDKTSRRNLSTVKAEGALQRRVLVMVEELP